MTSPNLKLLFELLLNGCRAEGGDGDVACLSPDYLDVANRFETYLQESAQGGTRYNRDGFVVWSLDCQEAVYFSDTDKGFGSSLTILLPSGDGLLSYP